MDDLLREADLDPVAVDHVHRLVAEWQLLADLSFADLLLYVPIRDQFVVAAQMRPTTGPTVYQDDKVGVRVPLRERPQLSAALTEGRIWREGDPVWLEGVPVREESIPVRYAGGVVAVIGRDTNLAAARTPSRLEIAYLHSANELAQMIAEGGFPFRGAPASDDSGPRVGDGLIRLDAAGIVEFASPNALSAYRRLGHPGDLSGLRLDQVTAALVGRRRIPLDEPVAVVAAGRAPRTSDVEARDATVQLRSIPLRLGGEHIGAVVLVHDVTELRRRERQLLTKDATIREIHHRVKNNLQTVAALLRLQARRLSSPEARLALEESVRRVSSIALVHETLSLTLDEEVAFDEIADQVLAMVTEVATDEPVRSHRDGSFGVLRAEVATPLALVLTELLQNAVEHGCAGRGGTLSIVVRRGEDRLRVAVRDEGPGLPAGFAIDDSDRLGLQIVRTLVETELGGRLALRTRAERGTEALVDVPLDGRSG
jgi:two-component sensor histidine kinase